MKRREFVKGLSAFSLVTLACRGNARSAVKDAKAQAAVDELQKNWRSFLADGADVAKSNEPLKLSDAEWKAKLSPQAYNVLRHEGTEYAGSSPLNKEYGRGVFVCAGCALPLFTSAMKFDSGTGWPSFFTTIPGVFGTSSDYKLVVARTEYHCSRCGGHHGHVFDDGPPPTGLRYCNNGVALRFIPKK
jgi:peptide-methionine (R)-S-oxide reductase